MNVIVIDGNFVANPTIETLKNGKRVARFALVHNEIRSGKHIKSWLNVIVWNDLADKVMHWYKKGDCAIIRGALRTKTFNSGTLKNSMYYYLEADRIEFGGAWNYLKKTKEKLTNYEEEYRKEMGEIIEKTDENGFDLMDEDEME